MTLGLIIFIAVTGTVACLCCAIVLTIITASIISEILQRRRQKENRKLDQFYSILNIEKLLKEQNKLLAELQRN